MTSTLNHTKSVCIMVIEFTRSVILMERESIVLTKRPRDSVTSIRKSTSVIIVTRRFARSLREFQSKRSSRRRFVTSIVLIFISMSRSISNTDMSRRSRLMDGRRDFATGRRSSSVPRQEPSRSVVHRRRLFVESGSTRDSVRSTERLSKYCKKRTTVPR